MRNPGGRKQLREEERQRTKLEKSFEYRGIPTTIRDQMSIHSKTMKVFANSRLKHQKQKAFQVNTNSYEYKFEHLTRKMNDVKTELDFVKISDDKKKIRELYQEWKTIQMEREKIYKEWEDFTKAEFKRRELVQVAWENTSVGEITELTNDDFVTPPSKPPIKHTISKSGKGTDELNNDVSIIEKNSNESIYDETQDGDIDTLSRNELYKRVIVIDSGTGVLEEEYCSFCKKNAYYSLLQIKEER